MDFNGFVDNLTIYISIVCEYIDYFKSLKNFEGLMYWFIFGDRYFAIEAALLNCYIEWN